MIDSKSTACLPEKSTPRFFRVFLMLKRAKITKIRLKKARETPTMEIIVKI
jgi:hypothetical protein